MRDSKQLRRNLERKWRRSQQQSDRDAYRKQCAEVAKQLNGCKTHYYSKQLEECHNDQKSVFKITDTLLVNQHQSKLPASDDVLLAKNFNNFFRDKIKIIRANLSCEELEMQEDMLTDMKLINFRPATSDEINLIILSCSNSLCLLDPVPTWLLKECIGDLQQLITAIVNTSISTGKFPKHLKMQSLDYT